MKLSPLSCHLLLTSGAREVLGITVTWPQQSKISPARLQGCQSKLRLPNSLIRSYHQKSNRPFGKPSHFVWENALVKASAFSGKPQLPGAAKPHVKHRSSHRLLVPALRRPHLSQLQMWCERRARDRTPPRPAPSQLEPARHAQNSAAAPPALKEPTAPAKMESSSKGGLIRPLLSRALQPIKCSALSIQLKPCVPRAAWQRDKQDKAPGVLQTIAVK